MSSTQTPAPGATADQPGDTGYLEQTDHTQQGITAVPHPSWTLENIIPLAGQALVAAFREAMAREIEAVAYEELGLSPDTG